MVEEILKLINFVVPNLRPRRLSDKQLKIVERAREQIDRDLRNIEAQATGNLPSFKSEAHKQAVLVDSWGCLEWCIKPLRHVPGFRRQARRILSLLEAKDAKRVVAALQKLREELEEAAIRRS